MMRHLKHILMIALFMLSAEANEFAEAVTFYNKGNYVQALNSFYVLAKKGDVDAQYNVALIYAQGKGVKSDISQAIEWYESAAKLGNGAAAYNLAQLYYDREEENPRGYGNIIKWYEVAAKNGIAQANNNLGAMYLHGIGVKQNKKKAFILFKKAAQEGSPSGQLNLGLIYGWGPNIIRDEKKSYLFLTKSFESGKKEAKSYMDKLCKEAPLACKK